MAKAPETVFYDKGTLIDLVQTGGQPMKSFMASPATIERKWYVVDATGYTLGRLTSEVAKILRGILHVQILVVLVVEFVLEECQFL